MPARKWTAADAQSHTKKADTPEKQAAWAKAANAALDEYGDTDDGAAKAVAAANKTVDEMSRKKDGEGDGDGERAAKDPPDGTVTPPKKGKDDDDVDDAAPGDKNGDDDDDKKNGERNGDDDDDKKKKEQEAAAKKDEDLTLDRTLGLDIFRRDAALEVAPKSYDPKTRTADVMLSTGAAVRRRDWDGEFDEVLDMAPGAIRLDRLNGGAALLDGHMFWGGLDSMLGAVVPGTARLDGGRLRAKIKFSRSEKGQRIAQDLDDGIPINVSVGYKTHREIRDGSTTPETRRAVDWEPMEVSVVPVGAEPGAGFRSAHVEHRAEPANGEATMNDTAKPGADAGTKTNSGNGKGPDATTYATDMVTVGRQAGLDLAKVEDAITRKLTVEQFRAEIIANMANDAANRETGSANGAATPGEGIDPYFRGQNEMDGRSIAMAEAMAIRILASRREPGITDAYQADRVKMRGVPDQVARAFRIADQIDKPDNPRTADYMRRGWSELAAECLNYRGNIRTFRQAEELITRAFHSTSDFPAIFANVLNKVLLARYTLQMPTYREVAIERPFNDFRPHPQIRAGEFPLPQPITETGELKAGTSFDNREDLTVKPYGTIFTISRQMLVNDDLGAVDEILGTSGMAVIQFENNTFYAMFNSNPTLMQDGNAVFSAAHNNLVATGAEADVGSVGQGRALMRQQRSLSNNLIDTPPTIIMSGPRHETRLEQLTSMLNPTIVGAVNPFANKLRPVITALITGDEWYMFCNPTMVPVFAYGFLSGATGPRIRTDEPFGYQGVRMSLEVDFGCGAIDFRGGFKNVGAAPTNILGLYATVTGTAVTYAGATSQEGTVQTEPGAQGGTHGEFGSGDPRERGSGAAEHEQQPHGRGGHRR